MSDKTDRYMLPPYSLLERSCRSRYEETERELEKIAYRIQETLRTFGVQVIITNISHGPVYTRYEIKPERGVRVSTIVNLLDDIKLRIAAKEITIVAPIPGKDTIGIDVLNNEPEILHLRELLESREFRSFDGELPFAVGKDIGGKTIIYDIACLPHLLIAGATGTGKSTFIHTMILSLLYRNTPDKVQLMMIDHQKIELSVYRQIPHLVIPVITDVRKSVAALNWAVAEMEKRYRCLAIAGVRDLKEYNALASYYCREGINYQHTPVSRLVIIVDELASLMEDAKDEVENAIYRLAQAGRTVGIHLIIATQRPSVNVITGLIKANMLSRIAFTVSSQVDSRAILNVAGAEKLIGNGDMLFAPKDYRTPVRVQGAFVSYNEVTAVVDYIRKNNEYDNYDVNLDYQIENIPINGVFNTTRETVEIDPVRDEHFVEAGRFIIEKNKASIGLIQRVFKIGFNRAARIMDQLAEAGVVSEESSTRARQVLMTMSEFEQFLENEK